MGQRYVACLRYNLRHQAGLEPSNGERIPQLERDCLLGSKTHAEYSCSMHAEHIVAYLKSSTRKRGATASARDTVSCCSARP